MFLLDTDVVSNLMRPEPSSRLMRRLARTRDQQAISSISLGELVYGACLLEPARRDPYLRRLEEAPLVDLPVLPFDAESAYRYGEVRAELKRKETPIGDPDTRIAAIALAHGLTVVTGNVRHFEMVPGLAVENWLS